VPCTIALIDDAIRLVMGVLGSVERTTVSVENTAVSRPAGFSGEELGLRGGEKAW
jgi:hypothetical protein